VARIPAAVPAHLANYQSTGLGTSTASEDNLVPLVYVLQSNSPQAMRGDPQYIDGAEAGCVWLRNSGLPPVSGEDGILVQPCHFYKDVVEWIPRKQGGGFVARHSPQNGESVPELLERLGAERVEDEENPSRIRYRNEAGNDLIETRYHVVRIFLEDGARLPYVIPMTGTGHSTSRGWMFAMNSKRLPSGQKADSFLCLYRLRTKFRTNAQGSWYAWDIEGHDDPETGHWVPTAEDVEAGAAMHSAFATGAKGAETPVGREADEGADAEAGGDTI
jgi:hypothetical protein